MKEWVGVYRDAPLFGEAQLTSAPSKAGERSGGGRDMSMVSKSDQSLRPGFSGISDRSTEMVDSIQEARESLETRVDTLTDLVQRFVIGNQAGRTFSISSELAQVRGTLENLAADHREQFRWDGGNITPRDPSSTEEGYDPRTGRPLRNATNVSNVGLMTTAVENPVELRQLINWCQFLVALSDGLGLSQDLDLETRTLASRSNVSDLAQRLSL